MEITDNDGYMRALGEAQALVAKGCVSEAFAFVDTCSSEAMYVKALRASVYSSIRDDRKTLMKGVALWRELGPQTSPETAFQLAAVLQCVVDLTRSKEGFVGVLDRDRDLLREARVLYLAATNHEDANDRLRLVALVN